MFTLAVVAVLATPGPTNTLLLTSGVNVGFHKSLPLLLAEAAGYAVSAGIVVIAADFLSSLLPAARAAMSAVVGLYLLFVAATLWRKAVTVGARLVVWNQVFVTTLLNPKVLVFALIIIPHDGGDSARYFCGFIATVPFVGAAWIALGALARRRMSRRIWAAAPKVGSAVVALFALSLMASSIRYAGGG
jgi:threonine/homoserine/homoserine lactone efflux protein